MLNTRNEIPIFVPAKRKTNVFGRTAKALAKLRPNVTKRNVSKRFAVGTRRVQGVETTRKPKRITFYRSTKPKGKKRRQGRW